MTTFPKYKNKVQFINALRFYKSTHGASQVDIRLTSNEDDSPYEIVTYETVFSHLQGDKDIYFSATRAGYADRTVQQIHSLAIDQISFRCEANLWKGVTLQRPTVDEVKYAQLSGTNLKITNPETDGAAVIGSDYFALLMKQTEYISNPTSAFPLLVHSVPSIPVSSNNKNGFNSISNMSDLQNNKTSDEASNDLKQPMKNGADINNDETDASKKSLIQRNVEKLRAKLHVLSNQASTFLHLNNADNADVVSGNVPGRKTKSKSKSKTKTKKSQDVTVDEGSSNRVVSSSTVDKVEPVVAPETVAIKNDSENENENHYHNRSWLHVVLMCFLAALLIAIGVCLVMHHKAGKSALSSSEKRYSSNNSQSRNYARLPPSSAFRRPSAAALETDDEE